jgi:hypothetical protein
MSELTQNASQFLQTALVGQQDWTVNNNIVAVRIDPAYAGGLPLVAGQAFKITDVAGGTPIVIPVADATNTPDGVAIHTMKRDTFIAGDYIELALVGSVVYMQTSAAIARGAKVQVDPTGPTISTLTSYPTNASLGKMLDKPTGTGQLARVYINPQDPNTAAY